MSERQRETQDSLPTRHLKTALAYRIRLAFQDLYDQPTTEAATAYLKRWYFWATHSRLEPINEAARSIKRHWDGILRWFGSRIANGLIEGINSLVQEAKAKARGYRSMRNLKAMIYLLAGKLRPSADSVTATPNSEEPAGIYVEIAATAQQQEIGEIFRRFIPLDEGMFSIGVRRARCRCG